MPDIPYDIQSLFICFTLCDGQLRASFGGAYALDYTTVIRVADDLGIKTNNKFYRFLKVFEDALISELNKEGKK